MRNRLFAVVCAVAMLLAFSSCSPRNDAGLGIIVGGSGVSSEKVAAGFDHEKFGQDVARDLVHDDVPGLETEIVSELPQSAVSNMISARANNTTNRVYVIVEFTGYQNSSSTYIREGSMQLTLDGTNSQGKLDFESYSAITTSSLLVTTRVGMSSSSDSVSVSIPKGDVTGSVEIADDGSPKKDTMQVNSLAPSAGTGATIVVGDEEIPVDKVSGVQAGDGDFSDGYGTEANPFIISTAAELLSLTDERGSDVYYALGDDIVITEAECNIESFAGTLDGRGHYITYAQPDPRGSSDPACGLILEVNGPSVIKNLEYRMVGIKSLVLYSKDSLVFEDVDATGSVELEDSNVGAYLVYPSGSGEYTVSFIGCESAVDYTDDGSRYGSHFIAYYPLNYSVKFVFEDCIVSGSSAVSRAGVLFGNSSEFASWGKNVTVKNLIISGEILSTDATFPAGIISWDNGTGVVSAADQAILGEVTGEENVRTLPTDLLATCKDGTITITSCPEGATALELMARPNINYVNNVGGKLESTMHRSWTIPIQTLTPVPQTIDVSMYYTCDESYVGLPAGTEHCASFTEDDKTIFYVANTEPYYENAYFGSGMPNFTKDEDGIVKVSGFQLVARDGNGDIVGICSLSNN